MKRVALLTTLIGMVFIGSFMGSCSKSSSPAKPTLYDSLGGTAMTPDPANSGTMIEKGRLGIRSVVDSAIFVIAGDSKINSYFMTLLTEVGNNNFTGFNALSKNLTDFICVGTGARNFSYTGKSMTAAHNPATNSRINNTIDAADFNEFVGDVVVAAQKNSVPPNLINSLGVILFSLESQVVQR
jgi:hypothetical protein